MKYQKIYVKPAIEVIHMIEEGGLCNYTVDKQEKYGPQNETKNGHNSSSFSEDYGNIFGSGSSSAKALGAEPVGESTYDTLEH